MVSKMENIKLKGAKNVRDMGGLTNKEGKKLKEHIFLRADSLDKLNKKDIKILKEKYNLATIIDLRTNKEIEEKPDVKIENVKYIHIPVFDEGAVGITHDKKSEEEVLEKVPDMIELYNHMVTDEFCINQLKLIFNEIINTQNHAILFHCTVGKDRTGIIAMLILSLLDFDMETILEDYLYTNIASKKQANMYYKLVLTLTKNKDLANKVRKIFIADKEYLETSVKAINQIHGGVDIFIENKLGISEEVKNKLKLELLY